MHPDNTNYQPKVVSQQDGTEFEVKEYRTLADTSEAQIDRKIKNAAELGYTVHTFQAVFDDANNQLTFVALVVR